MAVRTAEAHWEGSLFAGQGEVELMSSGLGHFEVTWATRAEDPNHHTSPEGRSLHLLQHGTVKCPC
jgi:osmotically inducible protein OsmC